MKQSSEKRTVRGTSLARSARTRIACSSERTLKLVIAFTIGVALTGAGVIAAGVHTYKHTIADRVDMTRPSVILPMRQAGALPSVKSYSRLSHQPEAARVGRVLGPRFLSPGREKTTLVGTLTVGSEVNAIRIARTQTDNGEQVEIGIGAGSSPTMTWNAVDGARVNGVLSAATRAIIERLVLDSPDEFIFAQLRGASYYTLARNVMPKSAGGSVDYNGPVWDVVRVTEPQAAGDDWTLSKSRTYHINTTTGLIDRSFSQEQGVTLVAEYSSWIDRFGDKIPTHIIWSIDGNVAMELTLNNIAINPKL